MRTAILLCCVSALTAAAAASVRYRASALAWLKYLWSASSGVASNPAGMVSFGLFPGPTSRIYQREVY